MESDKKPPICTCHKFGNSEPAKVCAKHFDREIQALTTGTTFCECGRFYARTHRLAHLRAYHPTKGDAA